MKAVRYSQFGGPEVLEIVDLPPGERPRLDAFRPAAGVNGFPKRETQRRLSADERIRTADPLFTNQDLGRPQRTREC